MAEVEAARATSAAGRQFGASLVELVIGLAVAGILLQAAAPSFVRWRQLRRLHLAGWSLVMAGVGLRAAAAADGRTRAIVFDLDPEPGWLLAVDGDGDGVRRADLQAGVDRGLRPRTVISKRFAGVEIGLPPGRRGINGRAVDDGTVLGRSDILSFGPSGGASTGTVYLRNRFGDAVAVRVYGPTGRLALWEIRQSQTSWARVW